MSLTKASNSMLSSAPVSVLDFGADPTGVANSSTAVIRKYDNTGVLTAGDNFVGTLTYFTT